MPDNKTPGVYVEEISTVPARVLPAATGIPAFIGYTQKARGSNQESLLNIPTRIVSLSEYEVFFGKAADEKKIAIIIEQEQNEVGVTDEKLSVVFNGACSRHIMYYALQSYFFNGGGPCFIVSAGDFKEHTGDELSLAEMTAALNSLTAEEEPTLLVFPEGQYMDELDYYCLINHALAQCQLSKKRFCIIDLHYTGSLKGGVTLPAAVASFRKGITKHLKFGAAYFPNIQTVFPYQYEECAVNILHTVNGNAGSLNGATLDHLNNSLHALYDVATYVRLKAAIETRGVVLPPSAAIAGVYAATDAGKGVWKAPANVSLNGVRRLTYALNSLEQDLLNIDAVEGKSINAIRYFAGKGIIVWGARTLAGNDNEWRYVPVRLFFNGVEESCKKAAGMFVFESNDASTWVKVKAMIENYLTLLWRQGALAGAKPEHAFYVSCGLNQTMTRQDVSEGKLIVEIGMAVVRPAEFILLRFSVQLQPS